MNPATSSLYLSDIIHHHLACGVVFLVAGHLYRTQFGIGLSLSELLTAHKTQAVTSWHFQLSINLAILGTGSILAGHLLTALPAYAYLRYDWSTGLSLFVHHAWIGGFFIVGAGAHGAIYLVKECQLWAYTVVERVLAHR
jgi:photosystem I P700 chlorophyll a apoprotein A1